MILLKLVIVPFGLIYVVAMSGLFFLQREIQYFPSRLDPPPEAMGLVGVTRQEIMTADGERLVLWYATPEGDRPVILFLHGNAGAVANRADRLALYQARGFGAAFVSYRGFGGSSGQPTEAGLASDAQAAYDYSLSLGHPPDRIALVGESLGTAPAIQLAARNPVAAVVLEAPFTAAVDVARDLYPWAPVDLLMLDQYRSRDLMSKIAAPVLILHGEADQVVPFAHGQALYDLSLEPKTFASLGPVGHEALFDPLTWALGADFVDALLPAP